MSRSTSFAKTLPRRVSHAPGSIKAMGLATLGAVLVLAVPVAAQPLPPDTIACSMSGYSIAKGRAGAPVRAEPNATAKVLGRLAPPQKATADDSHELAVADGVWRTQFQVVGFRQGWFLIEKALHPYDDPDRRSVLGRRSTGGVKTYTAMGWISLDDVGGKYTYYHRSMTAGALYSEPNADAKRLPAKNALGFDMQGGNSPKTVLGCSGEWVKVESHDGVVGWWKGLCGEPIADCARQ
jgi:hypothetical protein